MNDFAHQIKDIKKVESGQIIEFDYFDFMHFVL